MSRQMLPILLAPCLAARASPRSTQALGPILPAISFPIALTWLRVSRPVTALRLEANSTLMVSLTPIRIPGASTRQSRLNSTRVSATTGPCLPIGGCHSVHSGLPLTSQLAQQAYQNAREVPLFGRGHFGRAPTTAGIDAHLEYPW